MKENKKYVCIDCQPTVSKREMKLRKRNGGTEKVCPVCLEPATLMLLENLLEFDVVQNLLDQFTRKER